MRPDFFVIDHMRANGFVSEEDYKQLTSYSERPFCDGLVARSHEIQGMARKKMKQSEVFYDLARERRQLRRQGQKSKGPELNHVTPKLLTSSYIQLKPKIVDGNLNEVQTESEKTGLTMAAEQDGRDEDSERAPALDNSFESTAAKALLGCETQLESLLRLETATQQLSVSHASRDCRTIIPSYDKIRLDSRHSDFSSVLSPEGSKVLNRASARIQTMTTASSRSDSSRRNPNTIHQESSEYSDNTSLYSFMHRSASYRIERRRVPDNNCKYITSTISRSSNMVIDHRKRRYDPQEPRASEARYEDYQRTKDYGRRRHHYD